MSLRHWSLVGTHRQNVHATRTSAVLSYSSSSSSSASSSFSRVTFSHGCSAPEQLQSSVQLSPARRQEHTSDWHRILQPHLTRSSSACGAGSCHNWRPAISIQFPTVIFWRRNLWKQNFVIVPHNDLVSLKVAQNGLSQCSWSGWFRLLFLKQPPPQFV